MVQMLRVVDVHPLEPYGLRISFTDGVVRDIDCSFLSRGTLGEPLRDPEYFRQVRVDSDTRTVVWPDGLDPAPELLHDPERIAEIGRAVPPRAAV